MEEKLFDIAGFSYNGFMGRLTGKPTGYKASFVKWTPDPGVGVFKCTDGKERNIPTFAVVGFDVADFPEQEKTGVMFGSPCKS